MVIQRERERGGSTEGETARQTEIVVEDNERQTDRQTKRRIDRSGETKSREIVTAR